MNIEFNKNEDVNKRLVYELQIKLKKIYLGAGEKNVAKQKAKGKLLAGERIRYLIDKNSDFLEIGAFAADGMYAEQGGCPSKKWNLQNIMRSRCSSLKGLPMGIIEYSGYRTKYD